MLCHVSGDCTCSRSEMWLLVPAGLGTATCRMSSAHPVRTCMLRDCVVWRMQVQQKRADENLADWIVYITTDADRQGSDAFVQAYARCAVLCSFSYVPCCLLLADWAPLCYCLGQAQGGVRRCHATQLLTHAHVCALLPHLFC